LTRCQYTVCGPYLSRQFSRDLQEFLYFLCEALGVERCNNGSGGLFAIDAYHQVSTKHLDAYLDELEFRFNNRENPYIFRDAMLKLLLAESLPYAKLIED
jgi:hypothetical protein